MQMDQMEFDNSNTQDSDAKMGSSDQGAVPAKHQDDIAK
jgi:hypothetical protein